MVMDNKDANSSGGNRDKDRTWGRNIPVVRRDDAFHVSLLDESTRQRFADAVARGGKEPLEIGQGDEKIVLNFMPDSGTAEPRNQRQPVGSGSGSSGSNNGNR